MWGTWITDSPMERFMWESSWMTRVSHSVCLSVCLSACPFVCLSVCTSHISFFLSSAVGEHDGLFDNKRFFRCPELHGVVVPIEEIHIIRPFDVSE